MSLKTVFLSLIVIGTLAAGVVAIVLHQDGRRRSEARVMDSSKVPLGILGDSDSSAYQDRISFPLDQPLPGGPFHAITFQWPEVLARLRGGEVELGPWAVWGVPRWLSLARVRDALGAPWRAPQKQTHQHNLAWPSGCESLVQGPWRQTQRLVDVMNEQPQAWAQGVVVIRIGVNSFGQGQDLEALAGNPRDPRVLGAIRDCVAHIRSAVQLIHAHHPSTRIVLVGIFDNANWAPHLDRWQSPSALANIQQGLNQFDAALREWAGTDSRLAFFDDRAWFASLWGGRDPVTGLPSYRSVRLGKHLEVSNTAGDAPSHAVLSNLHAGLAWNLLWTQALVQLIHDRFDLPITPISDAEAAAFVDQELKQIQAGGPSSK